MGCMKEGSFYWIWVFAFREAPREAAQETQMPFMRGAGGCPSALSRAPGLGVHRSAAQTLDRTSGRSRRRVCAGRAVRCIHRAQTICGEHDSVREPRLTVGSFVEVNWISIAHASVSAV